MRRVGAALSEARDQGEAYVERAPLDPLGRLVIDKATRTPAEISPDNTACLEFMRVIDEQNPVPQFKDVLPDWRS